jgi:hypothetical protein
MQIPDYEKLRENAGKERAAEMRRLGTALHQFFRKAFRTAAWSLGRRGRGLFPEPQRRLQPVPVRHRRYPPPYDLR